MVKIQLVDLFHRKRDVYTKQLQVHIRISVINSPTACSLNFVKSMGNFCKVFAAYKQVRDSTAFLYQITGILFITAHNMPHCPDKYACHESSKYFKMYNSYGLTRFPL